MPTERDCSLRSKLLRTIRVIATTVLLIMFCSMAIVLASTVESERPGVKPTDAKSCPPSHPIKGNFTTYSGEPCIYHLPHQRFYEKTKPERCYATEEDAIVDGCRPSKV